MSDRLRIVVTGLIGQHPLLGGMTWHYLQYVVGLDALGHDVYYVEDSGEWPYNLDGGATGTDYSSADCSVNVAYLSDVARRFGFSERWAYRCPIDGSWSGLPDRRRDDVLRSADLLLNVSGTLARPADYTAVEVLAYVDTDPVFTQIRLEQRDEELTVAVDTHDVHLTFGECVAGPDTDGREWLPTRQPVVMAEWPFAAGGRDAYTTVMNWSSYESPVHAGRSYGQKDVEFARFVDLPGRARAALELGVRGTLRGSVPGMPDRGDPHDLHRFLVGHGWRVVDATHECSDYERYRSYVASSRGEWSVAKNAYVQAESGWFSDRSACYLASGRPVVLQDTGYSRLFPTGDGLLSFRTVEEAVAALEKVESAYEHHRRAAREVARGHFASDVVLPRLISACSTAPRHAGART